MLLSDFLQTRNLNVGAGSPIDSQQTSQKTAPKVNEAGNTFAQELRQQIEKQGGVQFSSHAIKRLESRDSDTCTPMFITKLFPVAKKWKQPQCPSAGKWINNIQWGIFQS